MVHQICRVPLKVDAYLKEYNHIVSLASINGYSKKFIDSLVQKHAKKVKKSQLSTLFAQQRLMEKNSQDVRQRVSMGFVPEVTNKLKRVFTKNHLTMVFSNRHKLSNLLGSTKDVTPSIKKAGIYEISCQNCDSKYYGQTQRNILVRWKEHLAHIKYNRPEKSAVAYHMLTYDHTTSLNHLKLVKEINNKKNLDAYESYFIQSAENVMNNDNGPIASSLFALV